MLFIYFAYIYLETIIIIMAMLLMIVHSDGAVVIYPHYDLQ